MPQTVNIEHGADTDHIARVVMARFKRASDFRRNFKLDGNVGALEWQRRVDRMHHKIHEPEEVRAFPDMRFYLGIGRLKEDGTSAAINDLVSPIIDKPFNLTPTPRPSLSKDGQAEVKRQLQQQLVDVLNANGLRPEDLVRDGGAHPQVADWIKQTTSKLRGTRMNIEKTLMAGAIMDETSVIADWFAESNWKMEFTDFMRNGLRDLTTYIRGVEMVKKPVNKWNGNKFVTVYDLVPSFRCIPWYNAYPGTDSRTANDGEGFTELTDISKEDLTLLISDKRYNGQNIAKILTEREFCSREWLMEEFASRPNKVNEKWHGNETIARIIHQGKFSGRELGKAGITGVADNDLVDMEVEIIGNRCIRLDHVKSPGGTRNVFSCSYRMGSGAQGSSINSILYDSQLRINRLYRLVSKATAQQAGAVYFASMDGLKGTDLDGVFQPFEVNPLNSKADIKNVISMQQPQPTYTQLWNQLLAEVKMTDEISGVSILNYAAPQNGPGLRTATGMSLLFASAAKQLKNYMYMIDTYVLPPVLKNMHRMAVSTTPGLVYAADANIASAGLSALLARELQEARVTESLGLLTQAQAQGLLPKELVTDAFDTYAESLGLNPTKYGLSNSNGMEINSALASSSPGTTVKIAPQTPVSPAMLDGGLTKGNNAARVL